MKYGRVAKVVGCSTAVDPDLQPILVSTGDDNKIEMLTVQVKVGKNDIRIINAYQSCKKLVSWVSWIPRNISQNVKIEEHSVKITTNLLIFM